MLIRKSIIRITIPWLALFAAVSVSADTNQALTELLNALVANKTLTAEQAAIVQQAANGKPVDAKPAPTPLKEQPGVTSKAQAPVVYTTPKEKSITRLSIFGKIHPQFDHLATKVSNGPILATRNTFTMRRLQLGISGEITSDWSGVVEGDFAASNTLEQGYISYKGMPHAEFIFGHTKAPFLREELISDASIKGVERSAAHRAFVEQPGRAFGGKNTGVQFRTSYADGLNVAAAITNSGAKNSSGNAGNIANELAYYTQVGFIRPVGHGKLEAGVQGVYQPDLLLAGPITATAAHLLYEDARLTLLAEYATGWYARTAGAARQNGLTLEPCFKFTPKWELVLRYSLVKAASLGISPGALIRNAPDTGLFEQLDSFYIGGNYYLKGNAVRFIFGYEHAKATGRITGTADENTIDGFRSRFQFLF